METTKPMEHVVVADTVSIDKQTIGSLVDSVRRAFRGEFRPISISWTKGEDLQVERRVPSDTATESPFLTPWEMVRQHSEMDVWVSEGEQPLYIMSKAAQKLVSDGNRVTAVLVQNSDKLEEWFSDIRVEMVMQVPLLVDPECPEGILCLCASTIGTLLGHVERSIVIRMEG